MEIYILIILGIILMVILLFGKKLLGIKWSIFFIIILLISIIGVLGKPYLLKAVKPKLPPETISQLINTIETSSDNEKIKKAVIMLGDYEVKDERAINVLKKLVETSKDDNVVKESIFSLVFIENEKILPYYKQLLNESTNSTLRKYIILSLKNIISKEGKILLYSIIDNDKDFEARRTAAYVLGQSKDNNYEEKFIKSLDLILSQKLISQANDLLSRIGALNEFLDVLTQTNKYKKYISDKASAENDVKMIEEFIISLRDKKSAKLKDRAFIALERTKLFDAMLADVLEKEKDADIINVAEKTLLVLEKVENLINEFIKENEEQEEMMLLSAIALGEMKSKKTVQNLIKIYKGTENNWLKKEIVVALGNIGDNRAENVLIDDLGKGPDKEIDEDIVVSLGQIKGEKSREALLKVLNTHPDKWIKIKAVESLGGMKIKSVIDEINSRFDKENDLDVKIALITFMGDCNSLQTKMKLKNIALDKREEDEARLQAIKSFLDSTYIGRKEKSIFRNEIYNALKINISDNEKIFLLDVVGELMIIEALPYIKPFLNSKNPEVKAKAIKAVGLLTASYK